MKSLIVSSSFKNGGAAIAANRLYESLLVNNSDVVTLSQDSSSNNSIMSERGAAAKFINICRPKIGHYLTKLQRTDIYGLHSLNVIPSFRDRLINSSNVDVVNFHWINGEMISIREIGNITKPIIMTLHDMWAFCGCEHYVRDYSDNLYINGYDTRRANDKGIDLNRLVWKQKYKHWKKPFQIVTPSTWLTECAKSSKLFYNWDIRTIGNPLNTDIFKPLSKRLSRNVFNIDDGFVIGFGAVGGASDRRKGFDLLVSSLKHLSGKHPNIKIECLVFGQDEDICNISNNIQVRSIGTLNDSYSLSVFYNAIDIMLVPSRLEAFGQTASEAHACGTPVVCFDTSGLKDIVVDNRTGFLVSLEDTKCFSDAIYELYRDDRLRFEFASQARERALSEWSYSSIARKYTTLYQEVYKKSENYA